ncbi:hypothetical protein HR060_18180 [Catenovulum sp. SM1970]|uniref:hypothetical protein n=1 Tax=Marinifaba aquimaris TaxID=2741323 RepID=UPI0015735261|nr:hypothetical protein [Marinifaba aquimaris]NTS78772.1 hypothetical protein [Marinifaba aquimaris]
MQFGRFSLLFSFFSFMLFSSNTVGKEEQAQAHLYLGQTPPGLTAIPFATEYLDKGHRVGSATFSTDLSEIYFRRRGGEYKHNTLFVYKYQNGQWVESLVASKAGQPFISSDGHTLHLGKQLRVRENNQWSGIQQLGTTFADIPIMRLTASQSGTYYFDEATEKGNIRFSRLVDGHYQTPQSLSKTINSGKWTAHPFIAQDESYLIWDSVRYGGFGDSDLYISFKQPDGSWGMAINLGKAINTEHQEQFGSVSPDGKYLFFNRAYGQNGDKAQIYWISAKIIEALRPHF